MEMVLSKFIIKLLFSFDKKENKLRHCKISLFTPLALAFTGASQMALVVKNLPASARDVRDAGLDHKES